MACARIQNIHTHISCLLFSSCARKQKFWFSSFSSAGRRVQPFSCSCFSLFSLPLPPLGYSQPGEKKAKHFDDSNLNRTRPRALAQKQHTRELISTQKTSHIQEQRPQSPMVTLTWYACKYKVHKLHQRYI